MEEMEGGYENGEEVEVWTAGGKGKGHNINSTHAAFPGPTWSGIVQLPAHDISVDISPVVITHSAPNTIVAYLHSAFRPDPPSNQSYIIVLTRCTISCSADSRKILMLNNLYLMEGICV